MGIYFKGIASMVLLHIIGKELWAELKRLNRSVRCPIYPNTDIVEHLATK